MKQTRMTALITSAALMLTLSAGCSGQERHRTGATLEIDLSTSYACEKFDMHGIKLYPCGRMGDGLLMAYYPKNKPPRYYYYDQPADTFTELMTETVGVLEGADFLPDGTVITLFDDEVGRRHGSSVTDGKSRTIEILDSNMQHVESRPLPDEVPVTQLNGITMDQDGNWILPVNAMEEEDDGYAYSATFEDIYILNPDFSVKGKLNWDVYAPNWIMVGPSGTVYALTGEPDSNNTQIYRIDCNALTYERLDNTIPGSSRYIMEGNGDYEIYYSTSDGIYGITADGSSSLVVDFMNSDLPDNVWNCFSLPDGTFIVDYNTTYGNTSGYYRLSPRSEEEMERTQFISLAGVRINEKLVQEVCAYNQSQDEYRIVIKDYGREMVENLTDPTELAMLAEVQTWGEDWRYATLDYTPAVEQFKSDLLAGTVPDIICMDEMPYQLLANKGLLTDFAPMLEQDERFNADDYHMNLLDGLKTGDKLERIGFSFMVNTMLAKTAHVGEQQGRTPEEYLKMLQSVPQSMRILPDPSREMMTYQFLVNGQNSFIDRGTMTCSFNSQSFVDLLTLTNSLESHTIDSSDKESMEEYWEMMQYGWNYSEDHTLLYSLYLFSPIQYHDAHYDSFKRADVTLVGYPDNCGGNGGMYQMDYTIALCSQSDKVEPVWEFIMDELGTQKQSKKNMGNYNGDSLPIMREPLHNVMLAATRGYHPGGNMNEQELAVLEDYIDGIRMYEETDTVISNIIDEEAAKFFDGDTTAQAAADAIQGRVSLYLSEIS